MKIALAVPRLGRCVKTNISNIQLLISKAYQNGATFVVLPEATLTGLINNDIYEHDITLCYSIEHDTIRLFCDTAKKLKIWLCFGFLENNEGRIHDSAVLINPCGEIVIHYRRINPRWRAQSLPADKYSEGVQVDCAVTPLGKTAIVICGDLFDDNVMSLLHKEQPDFILFPFARCFSPKIVDAQKEWDDIEVKEYISRVRLSGATVAMTNYIGSSGIDDTSFGGAFIVSASGDMLASLPLHKEGLLYYEI